ncbi:hypothetical protein B0T21DRAFT_355250 [Apiosordaria backusii]|uniref:Uncharacterized protein n=1 Tax=Apiosordaria backusii TaxID=314023 RepID=A0AA40EYE9_9PEZI|nr:hypothetical protein B0T21DRAFT_355250 [Apiosordaria backusii]
MSTRFQTWSPSGNKAAKIPRRLVEIPRDQEELLNRSDIWLKHHIPSSILEKVKASCLNTQHKTSVVEPSSPITPSRTWAPNLGDKNTTIPRQLVELPRDQEKLLSQTDAYSAPHIPAKLSDHTRASSKGSRHRPPVAVPSSPTPTPTPQQTKEPQLAAVAELPLPSSSAGSDEDAEAQVPKVSVQTGVQQPASQAPRLHAPEPTPPSAQIIPSTYPEPSVMASPPKQKRRRLMKNAAASLDPAELSIQSTRPSILSLPKPPSPPRPASSSIPPSSSLPASPIVIRSQSIVPPAFQPVVPRTVFRGGGLPESSGSSERPPPNVPASQDPYNLFKETYPDYEGSLGDFVRGVLTLIPLQKKKTVPQYLLDDYIRVFSGDYLDYIEHLRDDQRPLTTWEWYCENVPRPIYMKGVLSSDGLKGIRRRYPDKVFAIEAQATPVQPSVRQQNVQQNEMLNTFSAPIPASFGQQNVQQNQMSNTFSTPLFHSTSRPSNFGKRPSVHVAELASDPISTAEDLPFKEQPRTNIRRSTGGAGPATKFISASARQPLTQSVRPVNMTAPRVSSSSVRFETQVDFPAREIESSGGSIWDQGVSATVSTQQMEVEGPPDEEPVNNPVPSSFSQSGEDIPQEETGNSAKRRIEYRLSDENSAGGIKRPWEAVGDPEEQQSVQQQCFATFLAEIWGHQRSKGRQVGSAMSTRQLC